MVNLNYRYLSKQILRHGQCAVTTQPSFSHGKIEFTEELKDLFYSFICPTSKVEIVGLTYSRCVRFECKVLHRFT